MMWRRPAVPVLFALVASVADTYDYTDQGANWSSGTPPLYEECVAGDTHSKQSPIDLQSSITLHPLFTYAVDSTGVYKNTKINQVNQDLVITPENNAGDADSTLVRSQSGTADIVYTLLSYTIKTRSEHSVDGTPSSMELQVKFQDITDPAKLMILSYLFGSSADASVDTYPGLKYLSTTDPKIDANDPQGEHDSTSNTEIS